MKRDMMKTVEKACGNGCIPEAYDMVTGEMQELMKLTTKGMDETFEALQAAFVYGFVLGSRAERRGAISKKL